MEILLPENSPSCRGKCFGSKRSISILQVGECSGSKIVQGVCDEISGVVLKDLAWFMDSRNNSKKHFLFLVIVVGNHELCIRNFLTCLDQL